MYAKNIKQRMYRLNKCTLMTSCQRHGRAHGFESSQPKADDSQGFRYTTALRALDSGREPARTIRRARPVMGLTVFQQRVVLGRKEETEMSAHVLYVA